LQHGTQLQITGATDDVEGTLLVANTRQVDDHGVALSNDLRLGDTNRIHTRTDDFNGNVQGGGVVATFRLERHRGTTLEVEPE